MDIEKIWIVICLQWVDKLILLSDSPADESLLWQSNDCKSVKKTNVMSFGSVAKRVVKFNGQNIEQMKCYTYLGNIFAKSNDRILIYILKITTI